MSSNEEFEKYKELYLAARAQNNSNDLVFYATELIKIDDSIPWVWGNRGNGLHAMGFYVDAILNYKRAIELEVDNERLAEHYNNMGAAYWDMWNASKAIDNLKKSISIHPLAQSYQTLGNVYKYQGDLDKAIKCYRTCVATDPEHADGHLILGMALLKRGDLKEGWNEYEWRWKTSQLPARKLKCPQWVGENLDGKTILVYGEQGLGDIVQFARYATILAEQYPTAKVIVEGRSTLKRFLDTYKGIYAVINVGERLPELDYAIPMISLAGRMTPNIESIPANVWPTLKYNDIQAWKGKFESIQVPSHSLKVGICWSGMARTAHASALAVDKLRSTELAKFAKPCRVKDVLWVSLQKGPAAEQIHSGPTEMTIVDMTEDMTDFYETACAIANCDLVITVDTAVAHVAASLGVQTWVLSRWDGCWRWFGDREDSPWYPSMRQFVQPKPNDWNGLMTKVAAALEVFVQQHKASQAA